MEKRKKSQISIDFIIVLSIALAVFLFIFSVAGKRAEQAERLKTELYVKEITDRAAAELNALILAGDGAQKTIAVPGTARDGTIMTLDIFPAAHTIMATYSFQNNQRQYTSTLISANISGNLNGIDSDISVTNANGGLVVLP